MVEKQENAGIQHFLTFTQCFLPNQICLSVWSFMPYQQYFNYLTLTTQSRLLTTLRKNAFENIMGKGENAGNQHFLLFPQFSTLLKTNFYVWAIFILSSADAFNLDQSKILSFGKELMARVYKSMFPGLFLNGT